MIKIIIVSSVLILLAACSKQEDASNHNDSETSSSEIFGYESPKISNDSYNFPEIPSDDFYEDIVLINNEESYRKLRFDDFEIGTKIVGAGTIHSLQKQDDGEDTAIISTKTIVNLNAGLYEMLGSKTNFNGNLALLVFDKSKKTRVLNNDNIAFKGILAPTNLYTYTNAENKVENIPIIYVHYYQAGELTTPMINKFLEKPKQKNDEIKNNPSEEKQKINKDTQHAGQKIEASETIKQEKSIKELVSQQVEWQREPKIIVTNSDLEDESRNLSILVKTDEQGRIVNAEIAKSSGLAELDNKVLRAVKVAKLKPYIEDDEKQSVSVEIPFQFSPI
ncbi:energy transducer TonB [Acinetobacter baumannii]|nr:energy transducer TonB [Acinetobacter baumannii]